MQGDIGVLYSNAGGYSSIGVLYSNAGGQYRSTIQQCRGDIGVLYSNAAV